MTIAPLSRALLPLALALAAATNACGLPQVRPTMSPAFATGALPVQTVAVLPVDLSLQAADESISPEQLRGLIEEATRQMTRDLVASLRARGYKVARVLTRAGAAQAPEGGPINQAIHPVDLAMLRVELHEATRPYNRGGGGELRAKVAAQLSEQVGQGTGSDATLYARSWVYVAPDSADGSKVAAVVISVLLIILIVGIVLAILGSKDSDGPKSVGRAAGHIARGAARAAFVAGRVALETAPYAAAIALEAHDQSLRCHRCDEPPPPEEAPPMHEAEAGAAPAPRPAKQPMLVLREGDAVPEKSTVGLFISLVHNRTGRVLWHVGEEMPLRIDEVSDIEDLVEHFLEQLPPALQTGQAK